MSPTVPLSTTLLLEQVQGIYIIIVIVSYLSYHTATVKVIKSSSLLVSLVSCIVELVLVLGIIVTVALSQEISTRRLTVTRCVMVTRT